MFELHLAGCNNQSKHEDPLNELYKNQCLTQLSNEQNEYLLIPSDLHGFHNTDTISTKSQSNRSVFVFKVT